MRSRARGLAVGVIVSQRGIQLFCARESRLDLELIIELSVTDSGDIKSSGSKHTCFTEIVLTSKYGDCRHSGVNIHMALQTILALLEIDS